MWTPDESVDPTPACSILTDIRWRNRSYNPNPQPFEYELEIGETRRDWTMEYELGGRAWAWAANEWWNHRWHFDITWPGAHAHHYGDMK